MYVNPGDEYVGEFYEGLPTGVGQFFYSNGDREEVLMQAGLRHGRYSTWEKVLRRLGSF